MEPGIPLKESGIPLTIECRIQVPLTKNPESSTWNPESTTCSPGSKAVFDSFAWGEQKSYPSPRIRLDLARGYNNLELVSR